MQKNPEINQKLLNYRNKHIEFRISYKNNLVSKLDLNTNTRVFLIQTQGFE